VSAQGQQVPHSVTGTSDLAFVTASDHRQAPASVLHRTHLLQPGEVAEILDWDDRVVSEGQFAE
jgi:hypothetical protein